MQVSGEVLLEAMIDLVLVVGLDGRIVVANTAVEQLSGYSHDELLVLSIGALLVDEQSGLRTRVRQRIADGDVLRREESWLVTKSCERIPVSVGGSPLNVDRELAGIVLVVRDAREMRQILAERDAEIARRRVAESELRDALASIEVQLEHARAQLAHTERRATLGTLAGGVGHELRNIVQVHVAAVTEVNDAIADLNRVAVRLADAAHELERAGDHVTEHGTRLLRLARPGPDHVQPLSLAGVVRDVVQMLQGAGKLRGITVELALGERELMVTVNRTRIEQILVNLLINAADAITRPGTITIGVRAEGGRVRVEVIDTGAGMSPEVLAQIFEPYFTTKGEDRGSGMGLPVARDIVESYGGTLTATSAPGRGTTFAFDLPAA